MTNEPTLEDLNKVGLIRLTQHDGEQALIVRAASVASVKPDGDGAKVTVYTRSEVFATSDSVAAVSLQLVAALPPTRLPEPPDHVS
jgi:hypothetical protein